MKHPHHIINPNDRPNGRRGKANPRHAPSRPSEVWQTTCQMLDRLGDHQSHLDGLRLYVPAKLRERLSDLLFETSWVASPWINPCVRVIPAPLWDEYLSLVRRQLSDKDAIYQSIVRPACYLQLRRDDLRWHLPYTLLETAHVQSSDTCWICPNYVWLEIWKATVKLDWDRRRAEALAKHLGVSLSFQNSPPIPSPPTGSDRPLCADHGTSGKTTVTQT